MPARRQPRRIARELALLGQGQLDRNPEKLARESAADLILAATRTLASEIEESLEAASAEVSRGNERLLMSETRAADVSGARAMVREALELSQVAINRLGAVIELPELLEVARSQQDVRDYAIEILLAIAHHQADIDALLSASMVDWQLHRVPQLDRHILRVAVAEMVYLGLPDSVAINEAVELGKRYSDDTGYRFVNGVLRRVSERRKRKPRSQEDNARV